MEYELAKNQSVSGNIRVGGRSTGQEQAQSTTSFLADSLLTHTDRAVNRQDITHSVTINADYSRTFKPQQEWTISIQYSRANLANTFLADLLSPAGRLTARQQNLNVNTNQELTLQTDYQMPMRKNQQLEVGSKAILRLVNSQYQYMAGSATGALLEDRSNPAGSLSYTQIISAGYLSYRYVTASKYTFKAGVRYEHTRIAASATQQDRSGPLPIPAYDNLVPSLNIAKALTTSTTVKLAYARRIQRPGLQQLNPNLNAANPQLITQGNPLLRPEITDNMEVGISSTVKKIYLNVSLFGRLTANAISPIRLPSDSIPGGAAHLPKYWPATDNRV